MSRPRPRPASSAGRLQRSRGATARTAMAVHPELVTSGYNWMPAESEWQRTLVNGCVKKPKLRKDEAKLKELFIVCREANFREARAIAFHFPWLLAMTDDHGFTALHYAEMSGNADFMAKLLELYNDPRAFTRKYVKYESEEDLRLDGIRLWGSGRSVSRSQSKELASQTSYQSRNSVEAERVVVRLVAPSSIAAAAGVVPGDTLESVEGDLVNGVHRIMLAPEDISDVLINGARLEDGYPLTLEFHGAASAEILGRNSWTPLHAAAGGGAHYKKVCRLLRQEQQKLPTAAHDGHGCTPEHWRLMSKRSCEGQSRRPLSAGPCSQRRSQAGAVSAQGEQRLAQPRLLPRAPPPPPSP